MGMCNLNTASKGVRNIASLQLITVLTTEVDKDAEVLVDVVEAGAEMVLDMVVEAADPILATKLLSIVLMFPTHDVSSVMLSGGDLALTAGSM